MKKTIYCLLLCVITTIQLHAASSSSSGKGKKKDYLALDMRTLETTPLLQQPVGTKEYATAFTQAVYGKLCADKFCTDALRQRLKYLQEHDRPAFERLITQLSQSNKVMTHRTRTRDTRSTRFDTEILTEIVSPEIIQQLLKALKEQHQQQKEQLGQHVITIGEREGTIAGHEETITTQAGNIRTGRRNFYIAIGTTALGVVGTIVTAWIASTQSC